MFCIIFSECYMLSSIHLSSVCRLSPIEIFRNVFTAFGTLATVDIHGKFYGDPPRGSPLSGVLNTRGVPVAKYSYFGPIEVYVSEMVQDRR